MERSKSKPTELVEPVEPVEAFMLRSLLSHARVTQEDLGDGVYRHVYDFDCDSSEGDEG